jgi:hypothetical protein
MSPSSEDNLRVLAINPSRDGFGFAVLEGPEQLIDWGVKRAKQAKNPNCLLKIESLIEHYQPEVIALSDCKDSRRSLRVQKLIREIMQLSSRKKITCRSFSRSSIGQAFSQSGVLTKYQVATTIAEQLPELVPYMPHVRKPWMSEDSRMSIFDAVALALMFFYFERT